LVEEKRALTGIRGIAAWWVVVYHFRDALPAATPAFLVVFIGYGYLAVDLFFVLSGYVIALNYADRLVGSLSMRFYLRFLGLRLSRIYPLHLLMLFLFTVAPIAVLITGRRIDWAEMHPVYFGLSFLLMQGWALVPGPAWNVPAWSISVEWLAYLLFPALAWLGLRVATTPVRAVGLVLTFAAMLLAASSMRAAPASDVDFQWFGVARCLIEFSMGIGVWRLSMLMARGARAGLAALGAALGLFVTFSIDPSLEYVVLPIGFALLVLGLCRDEGAVAAILRSEPLHWLGLVSYSTYMVHYLLKYWSKFGLLRPGIDPSVAFTFYLVVVLLASAVLHIGVERPGQRILRKWLVAGKAGPA